VILGSTSSPHTKEVQRPGAMSPWGTGSTLEIATLARYVARLAEMSDCRCSACKLPEGKRIPLPGRRPKPRCVADRAWRVQGRGSGEAGLLLQG